MTYAIIFVPVVALLIFGFIGFYAAQKHLKKSIKSPMNKNQVRAIFSSMGYHLQEKDINSFVNNMNKNGKDDK
jgi:uncharacterized protein YneF (UPF0154 family)